MTKYKNDCECELCQVNKKPITEQYAYHYAKYYTAKYVSEMLLKLGIKPSYIELSKNPKNVLNELAVSVDDMLNSGDFLSDIEREHKEFIYWIKK